MDPTGQDSKAQDKIVGNRSQEPIGPKGAIVDSSYSRILGRVFKMALSICAGQNRRGRGATREHIATKYVTDEQRSPRLFWPADRQMHFENTA